MQCRHSGMVTYIASIGERAPHVQKVMLSALTHATVMGLGMTDMFSNFYDRERI